MPTRRTRAWLRVLLIILMTGVGYGLIGALDAFAQREDCMLYDPAGRRGAPVLTGRGRFRWWPPLPQMECQTKDGSWIRATDLP